MPIQPSQNALETLGRALACRGYRFICPTPSTYEIVLGRHPGRLLDLREIFGWNRLFSENDLEPEILSIIRENKLIEVVGEKLLSRVRYSTVDDFIFAHSAYPTIHEDSVFFGPDTYRFVSFIQHFVKKWRPRDDVLRILDLGCGSGVGGIVAAKAFTGPIHLTLADINSNALTFARANASIAGQEATIVESDLFAALDGQFDLIVMNPPYLCDDKQRVYRHGGDNYGTALPVRMVKEALGRLAPRGVLLAYTGAPILRDEDHFFRDIQPLLPPSASFGYEEIDPDIFNQELTKPAYADVDRIAAVTLWVER
jgi:SAM-dependent methyltransferase